MSKAIDKWFPLFLTMINVYISLSLSLSLVCLCLFSGDSMRFPCSISIIAFWIHPSCWVTLQNFGGCNSSTPDESTPAGSWEDTPTCGRPKCPNLSASYFVPWNWPNCWFIAGEASQKIPWFGMLFLTKCYCHWQTIIPFTLNSMDWFKGKSTGFYHQI